MTTKLDHGHIIDCNAEPSDYRKEDEWEIERHLRDFPFKWDTLEVQLYLDFNPEKHRAVRSKPAGTWPLNANVLDYLLKNPRLIPEEWKEDGQGNTRWILFWGTIYRGADNPHGVGYAWRPLICNHVRFLSWEGGRWISDSLQVERRPLYGYDYNSTCCLSCFYSAMRITNNS